MATKIVEKILTADGYVELHKKTSADIVDFDNSTNGMTATNVQGAVDELQSGLTVLRKQKISMPEGGEDGSTLVKRGDSVEFGLPTKVADSVTQKPISFKVSGATEDEFVIEFTKDGEGGDVVTSWNGRTGAVTPQTGDYTAIDVGADPAGSAASALTEAKSYTDTQIASIPAPDVSGQIGAHNSSPDSHSDIRSSISSHTADKNNPHGVTAAQVGAAAASHQHAAGADGQGQPHERGLEDGQPPRPAEVPT